MGGGSSDLGSHSCARLGAGHFLANLLGSPRFNLSKMGKPKGELQLTLQKACSKHTTWRSQVLLSNSTHTHTLRVFWNGSMIQSLCHKHVFSPEKDNKRTQSQCSTHVGGQIWRLGNYGHLGAQLRTAGTNRWLMAESITNCYTMICKQPLWANMGPIFVCSVEGAWTTRCGGG